MRPVERKILSRRESGTETLRAVLSYPADVPLLKCLADRAEQWVEGTLTPHAARVFADDPDPSKRFRFRRFEYELCLTMTPICDDVAELCIEATLGRARGERLSSERVVRMFRLSDGAILPANEAERMKKSTPTSACG